MEPSQKSQDDAGAAPPSFPLTFPEAEQAFVKDTYANATSIVEYGSGGSTLLAAKLGKPCLSVESDPDWASALNDAIQKQYGDAPSARAVHVDIGPTREWGYPQSHAGWSKYWRYPMQVWDQTEVAHPDVVLIDGRMRKACFATVLISVKQDTLVLFDDYAQRKKYHPVERFVKPDKVVGRMGVFSVAPGMISASDFRAIIPWFSDLA